MLGCGKTLQHFFNKNREKYILKLSIHQPLKRWKFEEKIIEVRISKNT